MQKYRNNDAPSKTILTFTHCQFSGFSFILFLVIFLVKNYGTKTFS